MKRARWGDIGATLPMAEEELPTGGERPLLGIRPVRVAAGALKSSLCTILLKNQLNTS